MLTDDSALRAQLAPSFESIPSVKHVHDTLRQAQADERRQPRAR